MTSSTETPPPAISRSKAWAYLITNAGVCPGLGSLMARRLSGLGELGLTVFGMVLSLIPMWHVMYTYATTMQPPEDTMTYVKKACVGGAIFVAGWLWSIYTGIQILRESKAASTTPPVAPPVMAPPPPIQPPKPPGSEPFTGPVA